MKSILDKILTKMKKLTYTDVLTILLVIAVGMLCLSTYAFVNRDAINEKAREEAASKIDVKTPDETTPAPTALPANLTTAGSNTYFVNQTHTLSADYVPANLTEPYLNSSSDAIQLVSECADAAKSMKKAAEEAGIQLIVSSGYVDYATQQDLYDNAVNMLGEAKAATDVGKAGCSEHQTGLAIDFTNDATVNSPSAEEFENSDAGKWLYEHAHEYGFILRYPKGKESITGYSYTPWHYRYVGLDIAAQIYAAGADYTFEEFFGITD